MGTHWKQVVVGCTLLLVVGVVAGLIGRYALTPHQPAAAPAGTAADLEQLAAKWAYPGSKIANSGRAGPIAYAVTTTPDDLAKVAAHYQSLVGRAILPIEGTSGGGGARKKQKGDRHVYD